LIHTRSTTPTGSIFVVTKSRRADGTRYVDDRTRVVGGLRIDRGLYDELKDDAERLGVSLSDIIRLRLRGHPTRTETKTEAA
jgi:hypothetical protein